MRDLNITCRTDSQSGEYCTDVFQAVSADYQQFCGSNCARELHDLIGSQASFQNIAGSDHRYLRVYPECKDNATREYSDYGIRDLCTVDSAGAFCLQDFDAADMFAPSCDNNTQDSCDQGCADHIQASATELGCCAASAMEHYCLAKEYFNDECNANFESLCDRPEVALLGGVTLTPEENVAPQMTLTAVSTLVPMVTICLGSFEC